MFSLALAIPSPTVLQACISLLAEKQHSWFPRDNDSQGLQSAQFHSLGSLAVHICSVVVRSCYSSFAGFNSCC